MNHILTKSAAVLLAGACFAMADIPSLINYQGRLTTDTGAPVTGTKNFALSIYDAATGGNLLYTETVGAVTLDANGVYSFQFGSAGTSNTIASETIATTDGTTTTFQNVLAQSPVVSGSVGVADGTYTWNQTAGSSNEDDFGIAYNTSLRRVTVNYYNGPPATGRTITATYRYGTSGITGALSSGAEHWMEVSVDGTSQTTRQRVLAVPFAIHSVSAATSKTAQLAYSAPVAEERASQAQEMAEQAIVSAEIAKAGIAVNQSDSSFAEFFTDQNGFYNSISSNGLYLEQGAIAAKVSFHNIPISYGASSGNSSPEDFVINETLRFIRLKSSSASSSQFGPSASISGTIFYSDGQTQPFSITHSYGYYSQGQSKTDYVKPIDSRLDVAKITISGSRSSVLASLEVSIWTNNTRTVELALPQSFVKSDYEYKAIPAFLAHESGSSFQYFFVDSTNAPHLMPASQWSQIEASAAESVMLRLQYTPEDSSSELLFTRPSGIVLLRRPIAGN